MNSADPDRVLARRCATFFRNKRVLITGGSGYLATCLCEALKQWPCRIIRWSRFAQPREGKLRVGDRYICGNPANQAAWRSSLAQVDIVFHLAGQTSAYVGEQDPAGDLCANVLPMTHLLHAAVETKRNPIVVFTGTVTQAGVTRAIPVSETRPDRPATVYDMHKLMAERHLEYASERGIVQGVTLRLSNVYGPGPRSRAADRGILNLMVRRGLAAEPLTIYGAGRPLRDYIYVVDVVTALLYAALEAGHLSGRHFVIGSGVGHSLGDAIRCVAARCERLTGQRVPVLSVAPPSGLLSIESRNFVADYSRFSNATGWRPRVMLVEGVDRTIVAFRENMS